MVCKIVNKFFRKVYDLKRKYYWKIKFFGIKKGTNLQLYGQVKIFGNRCNIQIGNNCSLNEGVILSANGKIRIGNNVSISSYTVLHTGYLDLGKFPNKEHKYSNIIIEDNVWIASHCIIQGGVKIGKNVVIGANSFVSKDLESGYFYAGNPVRKIRKLSNE